MPLILPTSPQPADMTPRPITARNENKPGWGGPVGRVGRPGTRWAWDIVMPPMRYVDSLTWDDLLTETDTVVMNILQPGLDTGAPGSPLINGANQTGMSLVLKGVTSGYAVRKGQWLSVIGSGGQRFAYRIAAAATAAGGGALTVPLRTTIRAPLPNNAVVEIAQPKVEGFATVDGACFNMTAQDRLVRLKFTIEERE